MECFLPTHAANARNPLLPPKKSPDGVLKNSKERRKKAKFMIHSGSEGATAQFSDRMWRFATCEFDELKLQLRVRGEPVDLELKPVEVLLHLLRHANEVVTKEELLNAVWPGLAVVDGSLATAVSKLRKALGDDDSAIILTVPRVGYRLAAPVEVSPAKKDKQTTADPAPTEPILETSQPEGSKTGWSKPRWSWPVTAAVAVALLAVAGATYRKTLGWGRPLFGTPKITSLAVLPMVNLSGDSGQDYLADGMTDELITELSQVRALKVISRTSVMPYKGAKKPLPQIARELGVDGVIEGSVVRSGDTIRVTAQLIYAPTDTHVWADSYTRGFTDILILQEELARQISREIKVSLSPAEEKQLTNAEKVNPQAHELYLKGRYFWNLRTREGLIKAVDCFTQATSVDPSGALAYTGLADSYVDLVSFGHLDSAEGIPKAKAAALKAIALDDSSAEPHTALAFAAATEWDWPGAEKEFQRSVELNPRYTVALYQYALLLSSLGRADEAISLTQRALDLDPISSVVLYRAGRVQFQARHYDKAIEYFNRILELNPNAPLGLYGLGLVYEAQGKYDKAILYLGKQNFQQGFDLAAAYAASGQKDVARTMLADNIRRLTQQKLYVRPGWVAEVYAALGDNDEAMLWLEQAYRERDIWMVLLKVWPAFDPLRSDPRFQELLHRMNFPPQEGAAIRFAEETTGRRSELRVCNFRSLDRSIS
jgi:TolB-like protein/DNA-binding winged helix-turn-helix (wHTH) protein/Flp pilus assembly protein TadD